jgi:hypothetical protein
MQVEQHVNKQESFDCVCAVLVVFFSRSTRIEQYGSKHTITEPAHVFGSLVIDDVLLFCFTFLFEFLSDLRHLYELANNTRFSDHLLRCFSVFRLELSH